MRLGLVGLVLALGCGGAALDTGDGDFMDDDLPMGDCPNGSGGCPDGNQPVGSPCGTSIDCIEGAACVAPFIDGEAGDFTCSAVCIANEDDTMWCLDASACCDPAATCNPRGLCLPPEAVDDTGAASGSAESGGEPASTSATDTGEDAQTGSGSDGSEASTGDALTSTG